MSFVTQNIPRVPEPEVLNFAEEELNILSLWKIIKPFETSLKQAKGKAKYSFYDGPPFATGLPHYGHILTGTVKDVITRYAHQQGFYVERRFGWDCHGLPVEMEIDKMLNIKGPDDVKKIGVATYNGECRKIIARYVDEWRTTMGRIGRWIDFEHDYKTMYPWYMESVWWVFKQLFVKGLVYHGNKIMPYSTVCSTPLSNFESGQNYKTVIDPAIIASLPICGDKQNAALLVWTTTPWTLPCNLAVCVNPNLLYARVREISSNNIYILVKVRIEVIFKADDYDILEVFRGTELKDVEYESLFPYYNYLRYKGAFKVLLDDYVSDQSGTGIVHQAPYFGEDDYRVCLAAGIITVDQEPICPIDEKGCFTTPIIDFEGKYFKDADNYIIETLKLNKRLLHLSQVEHSYPFCWRSDTPLIYKAVPSWFIRLKHLSNLLQECNSSSYWVPNFVKEKRFNNWLKEARDWAVSRNRYWGTPIPIWVSEDGEEICCVGSIAELEELTGVKITDLHRESIDHLTIPSRIQDRPPLRRVSEVFDCWFESGAMPYAQQHFPFNNVNDFYDSFPVDFIAEGIDQTRGWFYTLLAISSALFGKAPFKNVIITGLVLASDGQKMSKRKSNYPDPMQIVSKYGADALRLYLINSPVVRAENLNFKEDGVRDMVKYVLLPWFNSYRFLMQNIEIFVCQKKVHFMYQCRLIKTTNIMDVWILSLTQSLLEYVHKEMDLYRLQNIVPYFIKYFDDLTKWYLRMNRNRLKGEGSREDHEQALLTLFNVVFTITKSMTPFAPFFAEHVYQNMKKLTDTDAESVHFLMFPKPNNKFIQKSTETAVSHMQEVVEMGRILRDRKAIPVKYPLPEMVVVLQNAQYMSDILSLEKYICSEMNVRNLTVSCDKAKYGIFLQAKPDYKALGMRIKTDYKAILEAIRSLVENEINDLIKNGYYYKDGQHIEISFVRLVYKTEVSILKKYELETHNDIMVLLDVHPTTAMAEEGTAREMINRIQRLRKKCHLLPMDKIEVYYKASTEFEIIAEKYKEFIENAIKTTFLPIEYYTSNNRIIVIDNQRFKDSMLQISLVSTQNNIVPVVKWANVLLNNKKGLILLEVANKLLRMDELKSNIQCLFDLYEDISLWTSHGKLTNHEQIDSLNGETILILPLNSECQILLERVDPFCEFINFVERGVSGTIILENPVGIKTMAENDYNNVIRKWLKLDTT